MKFNTKFSKEYNDRMDMENQRSPVKIKTVRLPFNGQVIGYDFIYEKEDKPAMDPSTENRKPLITKKTGVWLIFFGLFLPVLFYPLTDMSLNDRNNTLVFAANRLHYKTSILKRELVIISSSEPGYEVAVEYGSVIFYGLLTAFIGAGIILKSSKYG